MRNDTTTVALAAIEDDNLLLVDAEYRWDDHQSQYDIPTFGEIKRFPRERPTTKTERHHQGDIDYEKLLDKIKTFGRNKRVDAYGVSTFGAVVSDGLMHHAPMRGQKGIVPVRFRKELRAAHDDIGLPVFVQNDASAAALGEAIEGAGVQTPDFAYLWVGRGVNVGMVSYGDIFRGRLHPEVGHIPVAKAANDPLPASTCPTHDRCITGLCSYVSLLARQELTPPVSQEALRGIVSGYLAELCISTAMFFAPARIAVGGLTVESGGLLNGILPEIRAKFERAIGDYPRYAETEDVDGFIVPAAMGDQASLVGMGEIVRRGLTLAAGTLR